VEREAAKGDAARVALPRPLLDRPGCDLSFSGLKTAVLRARDAAMAPHGGLRQGTARISARASSAPWPRSSRGSRARRSRATSTPHPRRPPLAVAGGVAANAEIRAALTRVAEEAGVRFIAPPLALCTDNAAMIAYAGLLAYEEGQIDDMTLSARPRWPLDRAAAPLVGSGRKGAKA
jgi:N6-L-threonylcarbamoyladenine synthase